MSGLDGRTIAILSPGERSRSRFQSGLRLPRAGRTGNQRHRATPFTLMQDRKLMGAQFDSKTRTFGQPFEVKFPPDRPFSGNPMTRG